MVFGVAAEKKRAETLQRLLEISKQKVRRDLQRDLERRSWNSTRKCLDQVLKGQVFECCCMMAILCNVVLVVIESDKLSEDKDVPLWIDVATNAFLIFYFTEMTLKLYTFRYYYFEDPWNILDSVVVGLDVLFVVLGAAFRDLPSISILRTARLLRLGKAVRVANSFHELHCLIRSFFCAFKAIFWGMIMVIMTLILWSILAVKLIHPVNERVAQKKPWLYEDCYRCNKAFLTVFDSLLTFWKQLVAGDSWGELSEPIVEEAPWTFVFFFLVLVTVNLMLLNLILSVIVEAGTAAEAADERDRCIQVEAEVIKAEEKLVDLCRALDAGETGSLTLNDFIDGYEKNDEFRRCLQVMHVTASDVHIIFNICDDDYSGEVDYQEFVNQIRRMKHSGEQMLLYYILEIRQLMRQMRNLKTHKLKRPTGTETALLDSSTHGDYQQHLEEMKMDMISVMENLKPLADDNAEHTASALGKADVDSSADDAKRLQCLTPEVEASNEQRASRLSEELLHRISDMSKDLASLVAGFRTESDSQANLLYGSLASLNSNGTFPSRARAKSQGLEPCTTPTGLSGNEALDRRSIRV